MRAYLTLARRELGAFLKSWTGYVIFSAVMFVIGISFWHLVKSLNGESTPVPLTLLFYQHPSFWLVMIIAAPVITMRSFALEKSTGTYETLMTTPVGDAQVVLAKFSGALLFFLLVWLPLLPCLWIVRHFSSDPAALGAGEVASTFLGITLLAGVYVSFGVLASALTRSQIIAAIVGIAGGFALFMCSFLAATFPTQTAAVGRLVAHLALLEHMSDFARGVVDLRPVVFYLSLTALFLILTWKVVESRRWK